MVWTLPGSANTPVSGSSTTAPSSQLSHRASVTSTNSSARSYRPLCAGMPSTPKFAASSAPAEVTMFHPARPPLMWSSDVNLRARLYGSE